MTRAELLDEAREVVVVRASNYGAPKENFDRIAARWRDHIKNRFGIGLAIDAASVAIMMIDIKLARLENQIDHKDSIVDVAGYAACLAEIVLD